MDNAAVAGWKLFMHSARREQMLDRPNYWTTEQSSLECTASVNLIKLGSGSEIYASILPALEQAQHEVILVTCFWARSETLDGINESLRRLSKRGQQQGRKIRVRICFSSLSIWQKLFHTRSPAGRLYPPSCWQDTLHLPSPHELKGLDLQIKSIFILPFSVMHPKFIILDRSQVFLPSCNVSWENWFEGCVELQGPIVDHFVRFWQSFWAASSDEADITNTTDTIATTKAIFLPSPHHALSLFDGISVPKSPSTPLNIFILSLLEHASRSIYVQTPNLTSQVVLRAILATLQRGVDVSIVTSERLMILEQLATARTTTARCVKWLGKQHQKIRAERRQRSRSDLEALPPVVGKLEISFYEPRPQTRDSVQSHIKLTIADDETIVLGSGNLDRASWVTSQELGVAVVDSAFVQDFRQHLNNALHGRTRLVYPPPTPEQHEGLMARRD